MKEKMIKYLLIIYFSLLIYYIYYEIKSMIVIPLTIIEEKGEELILKENELFSSFINNLLVTIENMILLKNFLKKKGIEINESKILKDKKNFNNQGKKFILFLINNIIETKLVTKEKKLLGINFPYFYYKIIGFQISTDLYFNLLSFYKNYCDLNQKYNHLYKEGIKFYLVYAFKNNKLDGEIISLLRKMVNESKMSDFDKILVDYLFFEYERKNHDKSYKI